MTTLLPGTEVLARGLRWEVVETQPLGETQTRVRLRGLTGAFSGTELDLLTPFEPVQPVAHALDPVHAANLPPWLVYHQAFLLEQSLGAEAFLAVQPGRLRLEPYQLVPLARALRMSRPRLLLADDVGLGKTVEAGLVIAELMARRQVHRLLVVSPAGPLLQQWKAELLERFGLRLELADRAALERIRKETELGANPFNFLPLALASMDFLKQDAVLDLLERTTYDLVVLDEAHHYSETGADEAQNERAESSQRRKLALTLARRSDALLLLTATPHDGYERSFTSLLELLDPSLVDSRGEARPEAALNHVVRRLKRHVTVTHPETNLPVKFPERKVVPVEVTADPARDTAFVALHRELLRFIVPELRRALRTRHFDDALAFLALLKRSVSTVAALAATLTAVQQRFEALAAAAEEEADDRRQRRQSLRALQRKLARFGVLTLDEEAEREALEVEELAQQLQLLERAARRGARQAERAESLTAALARLRELAAAAPDLKLDALVAEVRKIRAVEPRANILIYTEYVHSLAAAQGRLETKHLGPVLTIQGLDERADREEVTLRFRRYEGLILVSTDAAAEGLNLHERCHHLLHLELPWNPNRLEQRNGRIDRYGQWQTPVVRYLYLCGTFEERILARLLAKYERQRDRLHFMPNTLGVDVTTWPEEGLFEALAAVAEAPGVSRDRPFAGAAESEPDAASAEVTALLAEVDKSLRRFEQTAQTARWLGVEGAAADEPARQQALRALTAGQRVGETDLVQFVTQAVQLEHGAVQRSADLLTLTLPEAWRYGLEEIPGWEPERSRLRVTTDLSCYLDAEQRPVGYLGRAHPVVRRAIERVRHLALGQSGGLDVRVAAAQAPDGQPALVWTFVGRVQSKAGREWERVLAVRVGRDLTACPLLEPGEWLPPLTAAVPTAGLWERDFAAWGAEAQAVACAAAQATLAQLSAEFLPRYRQRLEQEQRDLAAWLAQRVEDLVGRDSSATLPLFAGAAPLSARPATERLSEFQQRAEGRAASEAQALQELYDRRRAFLQARAAVQPVELTPVGLLMLV